MLNGASGAADARAQLSALADGELPAASVGAACLAWKDDAELRAAWHGYQLIGDVLRSEDLASRPARDAAFMAALRCRLADEPVVLGPAPFDVQGSAAPALAKGARRTARWAMPSAIAAGFLVVGAALVVTRMPSEPVGAPRLADAGPAGVPVVAPQVVAVAAPLAAPSAVLGAAAASAAGPMRVIRDPQLDRYLAAHKQFANSTVIGMPYGMLRNASAEAPAR